MEFWVSKQGGKKNQFISKFLENIQDEVFGFFKAQILTPFSGLAPSKLKIWVFEIFEKGQILRPFLGLAP